MMKGLAIQPPLEENMSNLTSASGEASFSSNNNGGVYPPQCFPPPNHPQPQPQPVKKKRNQPGHPDASSEVIALSPRTLLATNRFVCEICNKGFQRDQNLQLHRRGHNLPWKLKQRTSKEIIKKVYVCPETTCVHHDPSRALGDLTGIKKHFCRKHGEKKWKCEKCSKKYAVQSDWKAHSKICGTKEYRCDCGTLFSRRDSFITHRAFCDALAEENVKAITGNNNNIQFLASQNASAVSSTSHHINLQQIQSQFNSAHDLTFPIKKEQPNFNLRPEIPPWLSCPPIIGPSPAPQPIDLISTSSSFFQDFQQNHHHHQIPNPNPTVSLGPTATTLPPYHPPTPPQPAAASPHISATALLQKATQMGSKGTNIQIPSPIGMFIKPHQTHVLAGESEHGTTGIGLNLSSRGGFFNGLASYGNKAAAAVTGGVTVTDASAGDTTIVPPPPLPAPPPPPPSLLHEMMMLEAHPLSFNQGPIFEDISFGEILNKKDENFHATHDHFNSRGDNNINNGINEGGGNDNMTRDFLGLRPLSQSEILSITGFRQLHEQ